MRLKNFINEDRIVSGDWVSGIATGFSSSSRFEGVYISALNKPWVLVAIKDASGKKRYAQVSDVEKEKGKTPSDLLTFAKKHDMFGKGLNET